MNTQRLKMSIVVLACAFVIGVSTITKTLAHSDLSLYRSPTPIFQSDGDQPSQDPLAQKLAHQRYQMLQQCHLDWERSLEVEVSVLFPIGRADRLYRFYDGGNDGSYITCYQRTKGKCRLVYQVVLNYRQRQVTKAKPVHIHAGFQSLEDYLTKDLPDDWVHPKTATYYTLDQASPAARKDLALKRDYAIYSEDEMTGLLSAGLLLVDKVDKQYSTREDPFTKTSLSEDQFFQKYGLLVTPEEARKAGLTHGRTKTKH